MNSCVVNGLVEEYLDAEFTGIVLVIFLITFSPLDFVRLCLRGQRRGHRFEIALSLKEKLVGLDV